MERKTAAFWIALIAVVLLFLAILIIIKKTEREGLGVTGGTVYLQTNAGNIELGEGTTITITANGDITVTSEATIITDKGTIIIPEGTKISIYPPINFPDPDGQT